MQRHRRIPGSQPRNNRRYTINRHYLAFLDYLFLSSSRLFFRYFFFGTRPFFPPFFFFVFATYRCAHRLLSRHFRTALSNITAKLDFWTSRLHHRNPVIGSQSPVPPRTSGNRNDLRAHECLIHGYGTAGFLSPFSVACTAAPEVSQRQSQPSSLG